MFPKELNSVLVGCIILKECSDAVSRRVLITLGIRDQEEVDEARDDVKVPIDQAFLELASDHDCTSPHDGFQCEPVPKLGVRLSAKILR